MDMLRGDNWKVLMQQGLELQSSGTTGPAKTLFQSPRKLRAANRVAIEAQRLSRHSRVLTVCRMTHAGGLLAQTLPALSIGAEVSIRPFNAYRFWRDIRNFTHTHLTPQHCRMLMQTRSFADSNFNGLFITCGSDNVGFDIIRAFVNHGAVFMCNWGMTEIGPIAINTLFETVDQVDMCRSRAPSRGTLLGDRCYCEYKIINDELWVRGDICIFDDWFNTGDRVILNPDNALYHLGRSKIKGEIGNGRHP